MSTNARKYLLVAVAGFLTIGLFSSPAQATRIKDIAHFEGIRPNQLIGYGLVVGLDGTGDNKQTEFTVQSVGAMLSRMGIRIDPNQILLRNVAAVMVTATLPAHTQPGTQVDILVSAMGNARSLSGGTLVLTPLIGVDGKTYAMAQGPIQVGGFGASGRSGSRIQKNHLNAGRIPNGALVERPVDPVVTANEQGEINLQLKSPDFTTARNISDTVNRAGPLLGIPQGTKAEIAAMISSGSIALKVPDKYIDTVPRFIALVEGLEVYTDSIAKIVINSRTGTVVMGENVRISPVAVAHGALTVQVSEGSTVSQPNAFGTGQTQTTANTGVAVEEQASSLQMIEGGATLSEIVDALNALGATPRDLIDILQAISSAGSLQAELEVH